MMLFRCLLLPMVVMVLTVLLCCQGCTIKFKASEFELDSETVISYRFEGVEFARGEDRQ